MSAWQTPLGTFHLQRYPTRRNDPLQAYASADTLLLETAGSDPAFDH